MPLKSIFHVNVNCSDFERSKSFYENLGFTTVMDLPDLATADLEVGLALPELAGRAAIMMLDPDDPRQARLDLIEWTNPDDNDPPYPHLAHLGINRIAIWTVDLEGEYERLRADGVEFLSEPRILQGHTRFVCLKDPDGTIIELIEFLATPSPNGES